MLKNTIWAVNRIKPIAIALFMGMIFAFNAPSHAQTQPNTGTSADDGNNGAPVTPPRDAKPRACEFLAAKYKGCAAH